MKNKEKKEPVVVIAGRPNVGKSTLFNRLAGKRYALIDDIAHTTRDYVETRIKTKTGSYILIDTGGVGKIDDKNSLEYLSMNKSIDVLKEADLILFIVEINNVVSDDIALAEIIRKVNKNAILVLNKADLNFSENIYKETSELGFGEPIRISAEHNRNLKDLRLLIENNITEFDNELEDDIFSIAIVGRPNVGKSTFFNKLIGKSRAIVSDIPGTTRDSIDTILEIDNRKIKIIDTAGLRRRSKISTNLEYYSNLRVFDALKRSHCVLLLMDITEPITKQDRHIISEIEKKGKGLLILINKTDVEHDKSFIEDRIDMLIRKSSFVNKLYISAKMGKNIKNVLKTVFQIESEIKKRIPTAEFNTFIEDLKIPFSGVKIYYGSQVDTLPPEFVFKVNKKARQTNIKRWLENNIRKKYGFNSIPIRINIRA